MTIDQLNKLTDDANSMIARKLINLPKVDRDWLLKNVSPETFARWCKQPGSLANKVKRHRQGEPLSELAVHERKETTP